MGDSGMEADSLKAEALAGVGPVRHVDQDTEDARAQTHPHTEGDKRIPAHQTQEASTTPGPTQQPFKVHERGNGRMDSEVRHQSRPNLDNQAYDEHSQLNYLRNSSSSSKPSQDATTQTCGRHTEEAVQVRA